MRPSGYVHPTASAPDDSAALTRSDIVPPPVESTPENTSGPCTHCTAGQHARCWVAFCWGCTCRAYDGAAA